MTYEELMQKYQESEKEVTDLKLEIENLKLELQNFKRIIFGSKREHIPQYEDSKVKEQTSLFEDNSQTDEEIVKQIEENVDEITVYRKKKSKTRKAGIKRSYLKDIEIAAIHIKLPVDENGNILVGCPVCGGKLKEIGKKVIRQEIEYMPAKLRIIEYIEYRYKCEDCGTAKSKNENSSFVKADVPKAILPHTFASPSLVSEVMYQKYYSGMPLYRQEKMWDDKGLVLPRSMMANWIIKTSEYYLEALWKLMLKKLKSECKLLHRR